MDKNLIIQTLVCHNERWPRAGIMWVKGLLLTKGDTISVKWAPIKKGDMIRIEFETATKHGRCDEQLFTKEIEFGYSFIVNRDGLHNFCIENPTLQEHCIGELKLYHKSINNPNRNPFPERYYKYELKEQNDRIEKVSVEWGYREDIGSTISKEVNNSDIELLTKFYNSKNNGFWENQIETKSINQSIVISTKKDEVIAIKLKGLSDLPSDVYYRVRLEKSNGMDTQISAVETQSFQSNEDAIYFLKLDTYCTAGRQSLGEFKPVSIELYTNKVNDGNQNKWKAIEVFNTIFSRKEKHLVENEPMDNK